MAAVGRTARAQIPPGGRRVQEGLRCRQRAAPGSSGDRAPRQSEGGRAPRRSALSSALSSALLLPCLDFRGWASTLLTGRAPPVPVSLGLQATTPPRVSKLGKQGEGLLGGCQPCGDTAAHGQGTQQAASEPLPGHVAGQQGHLSGSGLVQVQDGTQGHLCSGTAA